MGNGPWGDKVVFNLSASLSPLASWLLPVACCLLLPLTFPLAIARRYYRLPVNSKGIFRQQRLVLFFKIAQGT